MAVTKGFVTVTVLLFLVLVTELSYGQGPRFVTTQCGQAVPITNADQEHIMVNVTFSQPRPNGAACSWVISAGNSTMSNQVMLTGRANRNALSCDKSAFSISENNPPNGALNPLTLECMDKIVNPNLTEYRPVIGQPGFSMVVTLNTTSALSGNFIFMHVFPFVWTDDACPRNERKVVVAHPGSKNTSETLRPGDSSTLLSRFPDNAVCRWEFRSPDEGMVNLQLRTLGSDSSSSQKCGGGDHFVVSDMNNTSGPIIVPLCKNPGVNFDYISTTGSVRVNMVSDSSGGAYQSFYFKYWSIPSCPYAPLTFNAYFREKYRFKGSSFSDQGAGQVQQCRWRITTRTNIVIKLYQLEAQEFQPNCDDNKDYLLVNTQKVSICNSSVFPVWSEDKTMDIIFHTRTELLRRSFLLRFTAVLKSPCQGHPQRRTVVGSKYGGEFVTLMPIPLGDIRNGLVCQWIFTAKEDENTIQVAVDWAARGSEDRGVPFSKESCSFSGFHVYNGDTDNSSTKITPTCSKNKSTIIYTSASRSMLFVYRREPGMAEPGFPMKVNQVRVISTGASIGKDVMFRVWRTVLVGVFAVVLLDLIG